MFKSKKDDRMANGNNTINPSSVNSIKKGTTIVGEITSDGDIRFEGKLKGNLTTSGKLIIGKTGHIIGDIKCKNSDVEGSIEGKIIVSELLSLKATAKIKGEIISNKLAIESGAMFDGSCNMATSSSSRPQVADKTQHDRKERQPIK